MRNRMSILVLSLVLGLALGAAAKDRDKEEKSKIAWAASVDEALKEAKARNVPLFVYFGSET